MRSALGSAIIAMLTALGAALVFSPASISVAHSEESTTAPDPDDWLLNAPNDEARWKLMQNQLRGFSAAMKEVGERYRSLYDAIGDENYDLAEYQLKKIKEAIVAGYTRRPKRQPNADAIFVDGVYGPAMTDIKSGDQRRAWEAFASVRNACMACHEAEKVGFMNHQPLFRSTAKAKD
jgi:hypothetical protein